MFVANVNNLERVIQETRNLRQRCVIYDFNTIGDDFYVCDVEIKVDGVWYKAVVLHTVMFDAPTREIDLTNHFETTFNTEGSLGVSVSKMWGVKR